MNSWTVRAALAGAVVLLAAVGSVLLALGSDPALRRAIPQHVVHGVGPGVDADAIAERVRTAVARGERVEALYGPTAAFDRVLARIAVQPDDVVVDVGAGTGHLEVALLERGIPFRVVHALEIDRDAVDVLQRVLAASGLRQRGHVELRASRPDDVGLPPASADVVVLLDTPLFLREPGEGDDVWRDKQACLASIARAMAPGGRLHVFEYPFKLADGTGDGACSSIADAIEPFGFRAVDSGKVRLVWWAPRFPRHCWMELERLETPAAGP